MSGKQIILFVIIVALPITLLCWLAMRLAKEEQALARQHLRELLVEQLNDTDFIVKRYFGELERSLLEETDWTEWTPDQLRSMQRNNPRINQIFMLDAKGDLIHPGLTGPLNQAELDFLNRSKDYIENKDLLRSAQQQERKQATGGTQKPIPPEAQLANGQKLVTADHASGWYVWYWGRGLELVYWRRCSNGQLVGVELTRARWMADLIGRLPETPLAGEANAISSRIRLVNSHEQTVYQWGNYEPATNTQAFVDLPLSPPLGSWHLKYHTDETKIADHQANSLYFSVFPALTILMVFLIGMAVYFYRESSREIREAATRVNFVNQVSHELKSPLTNIRLYAELLEFDLEAHDEPVRQPLLKRLSVITDECGRLSRLINNVLTFSRQQRNRLRLHYEPGDLDELISRVLKQFQPSLENEQFSVEFASKMNCKTRFDHDAVEQILVNLISNVLKYATEGKWLAIHASCQSEVTTIRISDHGPGLDEKERNKVFEPFYRCDDRLEGTTGAGLGLAIALHLAKSHGGNLSYENAGKGAVFVVTLATPPLDSTNNVASLVTEPATGDPTT